MCFHNPVQAGLWRDLKTQRQLGLPIGSHGAVIVQVILREVGQYGQLNARTGQALFGNANRAGFNGAVRDTC